MSTVTPIQSAAALTQAHRDVMAYIQDLAITVSLQGEHAINAQYIGHTHEFEVHAYRRNQLKAKNFQADRRFGIQLPGMPVEHWHEDYSHSLIELQTVARELEALLTPPTGDDAA
ncbi:hypothetical protein [Vreelandella sp. H-I2]